LPQKKIKLHAGKSNAVSDTMDVVPSISTLAALAAAAEREEEQVMNESPELRAAQIQRRQYIRTLHKIVEQSDVIIMVLDARDPEGCRSQMVEDEVRRREADGKRLVFVLNKIGMPLIYTVIALSYILSPDCRPSSQRKCSKLAQIFKTLGSHTPISFFNSSSEAES
jgi:hypothetical protein